ncbi:MAG: spermidine synthase [Ideonella sp.]
MKPRPDKTDQPPARAARARKAPVLEPATLSEFSGVRYLHLGTPWVQGAMRIRKPQAIELEYVQRMLAWLLLRPEAESDAADAWQAVRALQFGLGSATITRFCHATMGMPTCAVEINRSVIDACRLWFALPGDGERLQVIEADAASWASDPAHRASADVLCVDLYDHDAASPALDSADFYRDCAALLARDGVMTVNLFGRDASFEASAARIAAAFPSGAVKSLRPTREGNTIVIALRDAQWPPAQVLAQRADNIEARTRLPARKWLRMLRALPATASDAGPTGDAASAAPAAESGRTGT